jgi:hypothetical protein
MSLMLKALMKSIEFLWAHSIAKSGFMYRNQALETVLIDNKPPGNYYFTWKGLTDNELS